MKPTPEQLNSVPFQYAAKVRSGEIVAGKRIKQAVERFYSWLENAEANQFTLNHKHGMFAVNFFPMFLNHTKGKLSGKPFYLAAFQQFTIYNIFGWKRADGSRRIRTVYDKRAKKNGKTAEMAGLSIYMMAFDEENEAEVYVGATKEAQAKLCFNQAASFINSAVSNPALRKLGFEKQQATIFFHPYNSKMQALGGDSKTQDGINASFGIIDEYHAHRDDSVKENIESSSVQRLQPLVYHITTAGSNKGSVCKNYEDSVIEVLDGTKKDDALWIMIHDLDEGDEWTDKSVWAKCNPLLGDGLSIEGIEVEFVKAQNQPSKIPNFKTKHLNMWVDGLSAWIPSEVWNNNNVNLSTLEYAQLFENKCNEFGSYAGLDLSSIADITAFVILSEPDEENNQYVMPILFCPEENIDRRAKNDGVPYRYWKDQNYMMATPGNRVDYNYLKREIRLGHENYSIIRVEADPWNASNLLSELLEMEIPVSEFGQTMPKLNFPTKQLEKLIYDGKIKHNGNPVMEWMLAACVPIEDSKGNIMISKKESHKNKKRIDGIAALINALAGSLSPPEDLGKYSKPTQDIYI
jgi:phage terminase large subunit-like protein